MRCRSSEICRSYSRHFRRDDDIYCSSICQRGMTTKGLRITCVLNVTIYQSQFMSQFILRNFQRICQKIVFSPTVLTKSLEAISQSEQIMHITVDSPKPKLSTFSFFYLSTRRFTANVQRAYPCRIDFRDNNNHKLLKLPFIQFQNC